MRKTHRRLLFSVLILALIAIPTVAVLAKELGYLTIIGPGIKSQVTLDNAGGVRKLEESGFFDQVSLIKPPGNLGEGYKITAYLNLDGKVVPFVQMVYYPVEAGKPGYVHYTGRLNGESLQPVDEWSMLSVDADTALRGLAEFYGIKLQTAVLAAPAAIPPANEPAVQQPVTVPSIAPKPIQPIYIAIAATLLLLIGTGLALRRRVVNQRSS